MRDPDQQKPLIPYEIGEMIFSRKCLDKERILLEARMKRKDEEGMRWDARCLDERGRVVMLARDIRMRWFFV